MMNVLTSEHSAIHLMRAGNDNRSVKYFGGIAFRLYYAPFMTHTETISSGYMYLLGVV